MTSNPEQINIFNRIKEIGKVFDSDLADEMGRLYAPLLAESTGRAEKLIKDIAYGPDRRNILDVYIGKGDPDALKPVLIFFHGGGFISGDKNFCRNVGSYFASNGVLTIIPSYRLAPEHKWPCGAEDAASVVRWAVHNAKEYGGDSKRIFLMGHSAGASHVATYLYFRELHADGAEKAAGAILLSGAHYDSKDISCQCLAYYGEDKSRHKNMSIIDRIGDSNVPVLIMYAEFDSPEFDYQSILLFNSIYYHYGISPFIKRICRHNHISEIMQFNTGDDSVGPDILSFINGRP